MFIYNLKRFISIILIIITILSVFSFSAFAGEEATVVKGPDKTKYYQGIDWIYDSSKKITLTHSVSMVGTVLSYNGKEYEFSANNIFGTNMSVSSYSGTWSTGTNKIKIRCDDFNSSVYAVSSINLIAIKSVSLINPPIKTDLIKGQDWTLGALNDVEFHTYDFSGASIKVTYTDSTVKTVTSNDTLMSWAVPSDTDYISVGEGTMYITYCGYKLPYKVNYLMSEPRFIKGDVSRDNTVNSFDALLALQYCVGLKYLNNTQLKIADTNGDKKINSFDALTILRIATNQ